jgi:hypothetical protein
MHNDRGTSTTPEFPIRDVENMISSEDWGRSLSTSRIRNCKQEIQLDRVFLTLGLDCHHLSKRAFDNPDMGPPEPYFIIYANLTPEE